MAISQSSSDPERVAPDPAQQLDAERRRAAEAQRAAAVLEHERDEALAQVADLGRRLARLAQVEAEVEDLRRRCDELRRTIAKYDKELNKRGRALERVPELEASLERSQRLNSALMSSASWRLTAPLRALKALGRR